MSSQEAFRARCEYYGRRCRQQLYRAKLSRNLALDHVGNVLGPDDAPVACYAPLVAESIETTEANASQVRRKLEKIIVQSHFLNLKVNFEFFLNRILHCLWSHQFEQLVRQTRNPLLKEEVPLRDVALALSAAGGGGKEFIIDTIVPAHGLDRMAECFKATTGITLPAAFNAQSSKLWPQIHSAFEVRHLIEHRNGKIDQRFLDQVAGRPLWKNSSWSNFPVALHQSIEIRESDFEATWNAMIPAVQIITTLASNSWAE